MEKAKEQLRMLLALAEHKRENINLCIIATVKDNYLKWSDYPLHSITTSYLSRQELDELISDFRRYCTYLDVYTDIEAFFNDYYCSKMKVRPTLVFESSSKGIGRGRDALIPAVCDILDIPHLGANASSGVLCSSKYQWTSVLQNNNIMVPDSYLFAHNNWCSQPIVGERYILKLNYECASIGLSADSVMVNDGVNITNKAIQLQKDYSQPIIAQSFIEGFEVEVPILANKKFCSALPPIGLSSSDQRYFSNEFFDYDSIYSDDYTLYGFTEFNADIANQLCCCAQRIIRILDLSGYMRIDFRVRNDGKFYVFDINNDPCINSCGSFRKSIEELGFMPHEIAGILIGNALI